MKRLSFLILLALAYWLAATASVHVFMKKYSLFEDWHNDEYAFERFVDRTAYRPFAYRALTPWMVNGIDAALPERVKERYLPAARTMIEAYSPKKGTAYWTPELERKYMITTVLMAVCAFAMLFALRSLTAAVFPEAPAIRDAAPLMFGAVLPLTFMNGGFLYDFTELLLMFAAFAFAWRSRPVLLVASLSLAVLNKETAALLIPMLSLILWYRSPKRTWLLTSLAMAVTGAGLVLFLRHLYAELPGWTMYDHIQENWAFWTTPSSWFASMTAFMPLLPLPRGLNLLVLVPLLVVLGSAWRTRSAELRHLLLLSAAINLPLFFLFCFKDELRNLSLLYPALYLNVCASLLAAYSSGDSRAIGGLAASGPAGTPVLGKG